MMRVTKLLLCALAIFASCSGFAQDVTATGTILDDDDVGGGQDFASRCSDPWIVACVGFDSQAEIFSKLETRDVGSDAIVTSPQAYPSNVGGVSGARYPAFDSSEAAEGAGSLIIISDDIVEVNHSGSVISGNSGRPWSDTVGAGEVLWYQFAYWFSEEFAEYNFGDSGASDGVKIAVLWRDEGSCSDLEFTLQNISNRGYPQSYTNCGGGTMYYCSLTEGCPAYQTDYDHLTGHSTFLMQYGENGSPTDTECLYTSPNATDCTMIEDHHETWWYFTCKIELAAPTVNASHAKCWVSRNTSEAFRQFLDFGPFPWSYASGSYELQSFYFSTYATSETSGHAELITRADSLIIGKNGPIRQPADRPDGVWTVDCDGVKYVAECPP